MSGRSSGLIIIAASLCFFMTILFFIDNSIVFFAKVKLSQKKENKQKESIIKTIEFYNKIITDFYASDGNPAMINKFPGSIMLRHHIFRDIGFLRAHNRILVYDMADVLPVNINIKGPKDSEAIVLERWNYLYQKREDRDIISPLKGMGKGFKYFLHKVNDHWIIGDYEPIDVEEPIIEEFRF